MREGRLLPTSGRPAIVSSESLRGRGVEARGDLRGDPESRQAPHGPSPICTWTLVPPTWPGTATAGLVPQGPQGT